MRQSLSCPLFSFQPTATPRHEKGKGLSFLSVFKKKDKEKEKEKEEKEKAEKEKKDKAEKEPPRKP